MTTPRKAFNLWVQEERKALRLNAITPTKIEWDLWRAFSMGWRCAEIEMGRQELKQMQKESQR